MLLIPAIDLKDGRCVRLRQGDMADATVFSSDPAGIARGWVEAGAQRLHLVDLNGAVAGKPVNEAAIRSIVRAVDGRVPIQPNGGLSYVIIGTAAVKNPGFLRDACGAFPGQVIVGLDAREGRVATDGWSKLSGHDVVDLARKFEGYGVDAIIYTDIGRDGMLGGVNIESTVRLAAEVEIPVFASGGVGSLEDIEALCNAAADSVAGVILGRALYEGAVDLRTAIERVKSRSAR